MLWTPKSYPPRVYIRGFLEGAQITNKALIENLKNDDKEFSSFFERAYRTRLGKVNRQIQATDFANFCLPENTAQKAIIMRVAAQFEATATANVFNIKEELYRILQETFPC